MKKTPLVLLVLSLTLLATVAALAQGTEFTYQGRLNSNGVPATGPFDLSFNTLDVPTGGTPHNPALEINNVPVSNGLFTVVLDFGFLGGTAPLWLEIGVRPGGSAGVHTILAPRQRLTPTPRAHYALQAGAADRLDGYSAENFWATDGNASTTAGAHFVGTRDEQPLELRANAQTGLRLEPASGAAANLYAPGELSFGSATRQMLNLYGREYAIGVQLDTMYFRTLGGGNLFGSEVRGGNFTWFAGGSHSDTALDPGAPTRFFEVPKELMRLESDGQLTVFGRLRNAIEGRTTNAAGSAVYGENTNGWAGNFNGNVFIGRDLTFQTSSRQMLNLSSSSYGIGIQPFTMYFRSDTGNANHGFIWYKGGVHNDNYANPGGGIELMRLVEAGLSVKGTFVSSSDRNAKDNIEPVRPREVLDKVAALPISAWNYKHDPSARHVGPMAQDFRSAFGLGHDDKGIATVDADGIALAAIQGLNEKVDQDAKAKDARIAALERELAELKKLLHQRSPPIN